MADRAILQMDQAKPENQTLHRNIRKCSQNPDHHRHDCLSAAQHGKKNYAHEKVTTAARKIGLGQPHAAQMLARTTADRSGSAAKTKTCIKLEPTEIDQCL